MNRSANSNRVVGPKVALAVTTAMAGVLLSGCAASSAAPATVSASRAEAAIAAGKHDQAINHAEAAVLAEPRNAAYRAMLGGAYLDAGRFASAATSFDDAMQLGDTSARTVLSLALARAGEGRFQEAAELLNDHERDIPTADVGLALALAGQPERGVHLMSNAIRAGENTAKMRQNLAYAYALSGRWREARLMAEQDVPADQVNDRIAEWAETAAPEAWQARVAQLLDVPADARDAGQPTQLALANTPSIDALAAEVSVAVADELPTALPVEMASGELPAFETVDPSTAAAPAPAAATVPASTFQGAFVDPAAGPALAPAPVAMDTSRFIQPQAEQGATGAAGTHLVQLGSFLSEQGARRAWNIYTQRYPELAGHQMVVSEAVVKGKRYWRVSAAGFNRTSSTAMCGKVRSGGQGCFAYAEGRPLPGAVDTGVRMARR
jgi:Flp pilus assembly protein TadD